MRYTHVEFGKVSMDVELHSDIVQYLLCTTYQNRAGVVIYTHFRYGVIPMEGNDVQQASRRAKESISLLYKSFVTRIILLLYNTLYLHFIVQCLATRKIYFE
jgi:hypothetical protein